MVSRVRARAAPREIQTEKVRVLRGAREALVACVDLLVQRDISEAGC